MSKTENKQELEQVTETENKESPEIVEIEWEEIEQVYNLRQNHSIMEQNLAIICVEHEKAKYRLLESITRSEITLNELGLDLLESKGIDTTKTHELKLPSAPGEKAYFVRKS